MDKRLYRPNIKKDYYSIPSKSVYHRALVLSAFADGPTELVGRNPGEDIMATVQCLSNLGADIVRTEDGFFVHPVDRQKMKHLSGITLDCRESGTTYRFMKELINEFGLDVTLKGSERLMKRVTSNAPTSQTISGQMLAIGTRGEGLEIEAPPNTVSRPYIELTAQIMSDFGCTGYDSPGRYIVEGDWSNGAVWACLATITGNRITVHNLNRQSAQGDILILKYLKKMGAVAYFKGNDLIVSGKELKGIEIDGSFTPDLVPIMAVTASFCKGDTLIKNIGYLRFKESDRLKSTGNMIEDLGGSIDIGSDYMIIHGKNKTGGLKGGKVDSQNDHRIAMAAAIASFMTADPVEITDAECVNKSYPEFWEEI